MKLIPLNKKKFAQVDDDVYDFLMQWNWFSIKDGNVYYAIRAKRVGPKKQKQIYLHRQILNIIDPNKLVDHKDQNGLNCQRNNLRICTIAQNAWNQRKRKNVSSKFKGVSFCKISNKWRAYIGFNKKIIHLGWHKTENEAAQAYNDVVVNYYGEFAVLNKIIKK